DDALAGIRAEMAREGIRPINVSPIGGKTLHFFARLIGAKRILEIGTLGGYSATWLARALPAAGRLISLELEQHHAEVSRRNWAQAGVSDSVEVRVGPAAETLRQMQAAGEAPFDLVFIDADKDGYPQYLELSLPLLRVGGLMLADNTLREDILDANSTSGIAKYNAAVAAHPELMSIMIPMLHGHGFDGLLVSMKQSSG
ncbi:MAG: O-methyltransferase, partial [Caldilineaceae bacterium]|nr:O-methyltransferase [Caldilineaceae bacterium]